VGIRIDDSVVFMTDTVAETGPLSFMADAALLIHEVWFVEPVDPEIAEKYGHSELSKVVELAMASDVRSLMPMHFDPSIQSPPADTAAKDLRMIVPIEGASYEI